MKQAACSPTRATLTAGWGVLNSSRHIRVNVGGQTAAEWRAVYWSVRSGDDLFEDVVWSYPALPATARCRPARYIAGRPHFGLVKVKEAGDRLTSDELLAMVLYCWWPATRRPST